MIPLLKYLSPLLAYNVVCAALCVVIAVLLPAAEGRGYIVGLFVAGLCNAGAALIAWRIEDSLSESDPDDEAAR